jgi:NSS family neurotransmitter:Na+ symporter
MCSLAQPAVAFLEDEFNVSRKRAVAIFAVGTFVLCQPAIYFLRHGVVDELDFWGGTFFLVVFAAIETILFAWVFGMEKAWDEIHKGADMRIPAVYKFTIKYITPAFLLIVLGMWFAQEWLPVILMKKIAVADQGYVMWTRVGLFALLAMLAVLVKIAWRKKRLAMEKIR